MVLPKVIKPTKKILIPSKGIEAEFEPFTTADEKAIISLDENSTMYDKVKIQVDILQKCCKTEGIDFNKLSIIEVSYLFLQLRSISVGGELELVATCPQCGKDIPIKVSIDLIQFDPTNLKEFTFPISTSEGPYLVVCSQLQPDDLKYVNNDVNDFNNLAVVLRSLMRQDGNDVIELTHEEKLELFSQLDTKDAQKIVEYIQKAPTLEKSLDLVCGECEHQFKGELRDFFI